MEPSSHKKHKEDFHHLQSILPSPLKKRRKSLRSSDDNPPSSSKRLRKANQQRNSTPRRDSDSDEDTSEERSNAGSAKMRQPTYERRSNRSPRPSKYNFFVEFGKFTVVFPFQKYAPVLVLMCYILSRSKS